MSRTRLDEIVEDEREALGRSLKMEAVALRIAERAFRHGVEQAYRFNRNVAHVPDVVIPDWVQPAPAEEKGIWHIPTSHERGGCKDCDRRRGQRRKNGRLIETNLFVGGRWFLGDDKGEEITFRRDRRFGNDRRKS